MHEFILNTKILYGTGTPQTADFTWLILLLLVAIIVIASLIVFKKKALSVVLSLVLTFSFVFMAPIKSFGDEKISITPSVEFEKGKPAELTITNNDDVPISINSVEIINQALPQDTTWDITFSKGEYEVKEAASSINVCIDIAAHSTFSFSVYPNVSDIPAGELCSFSFKTVSNHYTSTFKNTEDDVSIQRDFDFSFNDFVTADNTQLDRKIATIETIFGAIPNTYNNFILENKSYDVSDRLSFMRALGFQDNYYCKLWPDQAPTIQADPGVNVTTPTYEYDKNDVTSFCFNHRKINYGNRETEIINISVGATGGDFEWASNFDFGASEDTDYWKATGPHPEWTDENRDHHKGFDIAKSRLLTAYNSYSEKYIDNSAFVDKIILINGHSRGGGIANLLGKYFEDLSQTQNIKPFTYTLASPNVAAIKLNNFYTTIFNIVNRDDLVALFPDSSSFFYKYGQDVEMSIYEDPGISGRDMDEVFQYKSGYGKYNGNDPDDIEKLLQKAGFLINDRESAYTLGSAYSDDYNKLGSYDTYEEATQDIPVFEKRLRDNKLDHYAEVQGVQEDDTSGRYNIVFKACAAFFMQDISNFIFIYKGDYNKYQPSIAYNDDLINILLEAVWNIGGIAHSHIWTSYYLLVSEDEFPE